MRKLVGGVVAVVGLALAACGGKGEPTPSERVAQVVDKGAPTAKSGTTSATPTEPARAGHIAPDPAAPDPAAPEPAAKVEPAAKIEAETEPVAKVDPTPEPKTEPAAKVEPTGEPETKPVAEPDAPSGVAMYDIGVNDAALTLAIEDRFPVERKTTFTIGTDPKVYAWFDFKNTGAAANVSLVWKKEGKEVWRIGVDVGVSKNWRTWAEKKIGKKDAGRWSVDVVDEQGHVYETLTYDVQPAG